MGLNKWLNSDEKGAKEIKKPTGVKKKKDEKRQASESKKNIVKLMKYTLNCPNSKCKYQKIVMKRNLTEIDKICPRCKNEMKIKRS